MDIESVILETLSARIGAGRFDRWFGSDVHFDLRDNTLCVEAPTLFLADWIRKTFKHDIAQVCSELFGTIYPLKFVVAGEETSENMPSPSFKPTVMETSPITGKTAGKTTGKAVENSVYGQEFGQEDFLRPVGLAAPAVMPDPSNDITFPGLEEVRPEIRSYVVSPKKPSARRGRPKTTVPSQQVPNETDDTLEIAVTSRLMSLSHGVLDYTGYNKDTEKSSKIDQDGNSDSVVPSKQKRQGRPAGKDVSGVQASRKPLSPVDGREAVITGEVVAGGEESSSPYVLDDSGYNTVKLKQNRSTASVRPADGRVFATFADFVVGPSNRLAKGVADIATTDPGKLNPVFVFGPTSVGKTHLLEAVWSEFRARSKRRQPLYLTAEQFTTQFVQSFKSPVPFRKRFENISLFALDDIHFFQGKNATQSELISLIDFLKTRRIQMIFSADRPIAELTSLRSELLSRLDEGLVCSIDSPERETLLKIFRQMVVQRRLNVPDEVCRFVVSRFTTHVRQLTGALNRLHAFWLATGTPITLESAEQALSDLVQSNRRNIRLEDIENAVLEIFGLPDNSLRSRSRARLSSYPRMLAMYLARKYTRSALSEIGRYFGNRSHSTVISAQKRIDLLLQDDASSLDSGPDQTMSVAETLRRVERILRI